ncbi:MAG: hypothetical protein OQL08_08335 [Gammaproteobacteria bacterium]|nr:hypothetical protein [Gammaproteobacteria bacterium]
MRRPLKRLFIATALLIVALALLNTRFESDVHQWRHAGACLDCHSQQGKIDPPDIKDGWTLPPPASHDDRFRRYSHGRGEGFTPQRCAACHRAAECSDCHARPPESHTSDFVQPRGHGMERHILLATVRPASCLACHAPFASACTGCHTAAEVRPWEERAQQALSGTEPPR